MFRVTLEAKLWIKRVALRVDWVIIVISIEVILKAS